MDREKNLAAFLAGNHPDVPHVVYHGTTGDFNYFDPEKAMSEGGAFYFSKDSWTNPNSGARAASTYAPRRGGNIYPVHLSMKNPHIVGFTKPLPSDDAPQSEWDKYWKEHAKFDKQFDDDRFKARYFRDAIRHARMNGHDGVIFKGITDDRIHNDLWSEPSDIFAVFNPTQIKSATGNNGEFDPKDTDIRKDNGGGITAYHGSPHDFEEFDTSKIGTGEGAQAYGHGLYFAESEPIAKSYRDTLSVKQNLNVPTTRMITAPISNQEMKAIKEANNAYSRTFKSYAQEGMQPRHFRSFHDFYNFRNEISDLDNAYQEKHGSKIMDQINNVKLKAQEKGMSDDQIQSFLNDMGYRDALTPHAKAYREAMSEIAKNAGGHMYEVSINAHPDHFLDWDHDLNHDHNAVAGDLLPSVKHYDRVMREFDHSPTGAEFYEALSRLAGSRETSSKHLASAGIHGIKYLDAGSRGTTDNPTRNYVVFDHDRVKVNRKYAEGGEVEGYSKGGSPDLDIVREHLKRTASPLSDDPAKVYKALSIAESLKVPQGNKAGVGSFYNLVSPHAVKDVTSTVTDIPGVTYLQPRNMSWEDLYREGKGGSFINVAGDRTNLGRLTHINGKELAWPVDMHAGPKYMLEPNKGEVWANNPTHATGFKNVIAKAAKKGPVYGIYSPMGAQSGDFSYHMFDALMAQIPSSGLTKEGADYFNNLVKKGLHRPADKRKEAIKMMEKWPGIENPKEASEFAAKLPGSHRSDMIKKLDSKVMKDFGMPDVGVTRVSITDPALRDLPGNMLGHRVVRFDPDKLVEGGKSFTHTSYPEPAIGEYVGDIPPVQRHYAAPDVTDEKIAKLVGQNQDLVVHPYSLDPLGRGTYRKAFEEQKQIQPINQRMLESVQQGLENQKLYGFARGGSIDISHALEIARRAGNNGDTILAHINPHEAQLLRRMGGSGTINPKTGLPQFGVDSGPERGSTGSASGNSYGSGSQSSSSDNNDYDSGSDYSSSTGGDGGRDSSSNRDYIGGSGMRASTGETYRGSGNTVYGGAFGEDQGGTQTSPTMGGYLNRSSALDAANQALQSAGIESPRLGDVPGMAQSEASRIDFSSGNSPLAAGISSYDPNSIKNQMPSGMFGQPEFGTTTFGTGIRPIGLPSQQTGPMDPSQRGYREQMAKAERQAWLDANTEPESPRLGDLATPTPNRPFAKPDRAGSVGSMPIGTTPYMSDLTPLSAQPSRPITPTPFSSYPQDVQNALNPVKPDSAFGQTLIDPTGQYTKEALEKWKLAEDATTMLNSPTLAGSFVRAFTPTPTPATPKQQADIERLYKQTYNDASSSSGNFNQAFSEARARGEETFSWTNPKTGQTGIYTTKLKAKGGSVSYDPESILRHALAVAFRYGS